MASVLSAIFGSAVRPMDFGSSMTAANNTQAPQVNQTLLQKIGINVQPPKVNAAAMMRNAAQPAADLQQVKQAAAASTEECKAERATAEAGFDQAVGIAVSVAKEVAADTPALGVAPGQVDATYGKDCGTMEVAGAAVGQGLGSMATHLVDGASALNELKDESNKMKPDEAKALADEVACRINGQQSIHQQSNIMGVFEPPAPMDFSNAQCDLTDCTGDDILELLEADFEQCPEIQELDTVLAALEEVHDNHLGVEAQEQKVGNDFCAGEGLAAIEVMTPQLAAAYDIGNGFALSLLSAADADAIKAAGPSGKAADPKETPVYDNEAGLKKLGVEAANWGTSPNSMMSA